MLAFDACTYCAAGTSGSPISLARDTQICNFFFFWDKPRICNLLLLFHVFLCLYKEDQCNRLIRTAKTRERERGMDALNSTKPDDHQVVSPTRVLLHLSILSINIGFTLSYHFFYNFFTRGGRCVAHTYIL